MRGKRPKEKNLFWTTHFQDPYFMNKKTEPQRSDVSESSHTDFSV